MSRPRSYDDALTEATHRKLADLEATANVAAIQASKPGRLVAHSFADVTMKRARWLWDGRIPVGEITLLAGRQGAGKSTIAADLAAATTHGTLPGEYLDVPRAVFIAATEDSFEHTIKPRLTAAGADPSRVFWLESADAGGITLPVDLLALTELAATHDAALLILDPLTSRLGNVDTHKDADVRTALEPLVKVAHNAHMAVLGLIHHNKTGTSDPLDVIMGSVAFTAVARSALTAMVDPDDDTRTQHLLTQAKSNLGKPRPTLTYTIGEQQVGDDEGPIIASKITWGGEDERGAYELTGKTAEGPANRKETAADWLYKYLEKNGPTAGSAVKFAAEAAGHKVRTIQRVATEIGVSYSSREGFQGDKTWSVGY